MTDFEVISRSLAAVGAAGREVFLVKKGGRVLLALPGEKEAALIALRLYQPQRTVAKVFVRAISFAVHLGLHKSFLKRMWVGEETSGEGEGMPAVVAETAGVLIGNPDHLVRRAIVSFRTGNGFEVAKVAFGEKGVNLIEREATTIKSLPENVRGIPRLLGTHHTGEIGVMRMPYLKGRFLSADDAESYVTLLTDWLRDEPSCLLEDFPEWEGIERTLSGRSDGGEILECLKGLKLTPGIRHGDFAPWNLIRDENDEILALDWEWGVPRGVPGFDLIHYLTQELRLVQRLTPSAIVEAVEFTLSKEPFSTYLRRAGWGDSHRELFIAALAFSLGSNLKGSEAILEDLLSQ